MNDRLDRLRSLAPLAVVALSCTLFLAALGPGVAGQPGQSPLSPLPAGGWPPRFRPDSWLDRVLSASFWTSPLPWAAVGLILFSALAGILVRVLRRTRFVHVERAEREETALPPEWAP